jgi:hypothetical protein
MAGVLLPVANILQALSDSGAVLAGGKLYTYVAGTTTNQSTYKQQALSVAHANPIVLDSAGRLSDPVWATAGETFKLVFKTSADVQIGPTWDNVAGINDTSALGVTYFAGTSGGTANAQTLTFSNGPASYAQGNEFLFKAGSTNTSAATMNVNGLGAKTFKKEDENDLIGGEIIASRWYRAIYDGTYLLLEAIDNQEANRVDVASATTVDLDATDSAYVRITGSTGPIGTITLSNGRECDVVFSSTPTLTNGANLILPWAADITAVAGATARFRGEASSVVRCIEYIDINTPRLNRNQSWTKAQGVDRSALTDAATVAVDASLSNVFTVTLGGNRTLGQPTNPKDGQSITIFITQDGSGSRTLAYHADWLFPGGTDPTLTTTAAAVDVLSAVYNGSTTKWYAVLNKAFA